MRLKPDGDEWDCVRLLTSNWMSECQKEREACRVGYRTLLADRRLWPVMMTFGMYPSELLLVVSKSVSLDGTGRTRRSASLKSLHTMDGPAKLLTYTSFISTGWNTCRRI